MVLPAVGAYHKGCSVGLDGGAMADQLTAVMEALYEIRMTSGGFGDEAQLKVQEYRLVR